MTHLTQQEGACEVMVIIHKPETLKPETLAALVRAAEIAKNQFGEEKEQPTNKEDVE